MNEKKWAPVTKISLLNDRDEPVYKTFNPKELSRMTHPKMIKHIKLKDNLAILEQLLPETTIVRLLVAKINIIKQMRV